MAHRDVEISLTRHAGRRERQTAPLTLEQFHVERRLQLENQVLDRGRRHAQLLGSRVVAEMPGDRLIGAERIQRGHPVSHRLFNLNSP